MSINRYHRNSGILIRNLRSKVKSKNINSPEQVDEVINSIIKDLDGFRSELKATIAKRNACNHDEFNDATYTVQRRLLCFVKVYERTCKHCTHQETVTVKDGDKPPKWGIYAKRMHYNNNY